MQCNAFNWLNSRAKAQSHWSLGSVYYLILPVMALARRSTGSCRVQQRMPSREIPAPTRGGSCNTVDAHPRDMVLRHSIEEPLQSN